MQFIRIKERYDNPLLNKKQSIMDQYFKSDFWTEAFSRGQSWLITELPGLIIITIMAFLAFRLIKMYLNSLNKKLITRASKNSKVDVDEESKRINTLINSIHGILKIAAWLIIIMIILQKFGVNIGPILASFGILGIALGFGAQNMVRDFLAGFFIIAENQIRLNDVAIIDGTYGVVEKIKPRTTTIRDLEGIVHIFPNGAINLLSNMTKDWSAIVFDIRVAYKEKPEEVMELMKKVGEDLQSDSRFKSVIKEPLEVLGLNEFAESGIIIKARLKTKPMEQWATGREYRKRLINAFKQNNIEIPFPHRTIYWGQETGFSKLSTNNNA